jgi:hypothetical protein
MTTEARAAVQADVRTADERWGAWVAKGVEHDRTAKKRAIGAAAVIVGGFCLWAVALLLG